MKERVFSTIHNAQLALVNAIQTERRGRKWCITKDSNGWFRVEPASQSALAKAKEVSK